MENRDLDGWLNAVGSTQMSDHTNPYHSPSDKASSAMKAKSEPRTIITFCRIALFSGLASLLTAIVLAVMYCWMTPLSEQSWDIDHAAVAFFVISVLNFFMAVV